MDTVNEIINEEEEAADVLDMRESAAEQVKKLFPMLFTPKGNTRKVAGFRISGKNAAQTINRVAGLNGRNSLIVRMKGYDIVLDYDTTKMLQRSGLIADLLLAGYTLL